MSWKQNPEILNELNEDQLTELLWDWKFWARENQLPPPGNWATWLLLCGRGFGKTRTGVEWVHSRAMAWPGRWIALVAKTPADARDYMIDGPGGFMRNIAPWHRPVFKASMRRIQWPNGSYATIYSDELPDQLRGFSGDTAWLDEFAKFKHPDDCWDNLQFGMRETSNDRPRRCITTTPRPIKILKRLISLEGTIKVVGTSHENRANLDPAWFAETILDYENTRLGRQEIFADILEDFPGALWTTALLEMHRIAGRPPKMDLLAWRTHWKEKMKRIVIAIDPASKSTAEAAEHGIIVAGLGHNGHGYIFEDISARLTPEKACRRAILAYDLWGADRIIGEINNGGEWIGTTISQTAQAMFSQGARSTSHVAYKSVSASRGKMTRAEPISALDEQGRIHHVGLFPELEDQMCSYDPLAGMPSPDRMDARVWACTDLMLLNNAMVGTKPVRGMY